MSYPTIEQKILDDKTISKWVRRQILETRKKSVKLAIAEVNFLKKILDERLDRQIKESKTFKTVTNLKAIDFE